MRRYEARKRLTPGEVRTQWLAAWKALSQWHPPEPLDEFYVMDEHLHILVHHTNGRPPTDFVWDPPAWDVDLREGPWVVSV